MAIWFYKPNAIKEDLKKMQTKIKVIAICGKSAAGKDTLLQEILKLNRPDVHEIISCTTRPPREGEVHGKNYYFLSNQLYTRSLTF